MGKTRFENTSNLRRFFDMPLVIIDLFSFNFIYILLTIGYIAFSMNLPISIITDFIHDDALYISLGQHLANGDWLGPYNQMTLAKGPGFPIFLAINNLLGLPVTLSIALLNLASCWLIVISLRSLGVGKFLVLKLLSNSFSPSILPSSGTSGKHICIVNSDSSCRCYISDELFKEKQSKSFNPLLWNHFRVLLDYSGGRCMDSSWDVFSFIFKTISTETCKSTDKTTYATGCNPGSLSDLPVSLVSLANLYNYGKFEAVDFKSREFSDAVKSLNSVKIGK